MVNLMFVHQSPGQVAAAPMIPTKATDSAINPLDRRRPRLASRTRLTHGRLAGELGVTERTIARDIERLIHSGVPITAVPGRGGGVAIENDAPVGPIDLDLPEIAALMASLAAVGPTVSDSAASAMNKLAVALSPAALSPQC